MIDKNNQSKRLITTDTEDDNIRHEYEKELLKSIPFKLWREIETWGKESGCLSPNQTTLAYDISNKVKHNKSLEDVRQRGMAIFEIVCRENIDLLNQADDFQEEPKSEGIQIEDSNSEITIDVVRQMVEWDKRKRILQDWKWNAMKGIVDGRFPLEGKYIYACQKNLEVLKKRGFKIDSI